MRAKEVVIDDENITSFEDELESLCKYASEEGLTREELAPVLYDITDEVYGIKESYDDFDDFENYDDFEEISSLTPTLDRIIYQSQKIIHDALHRGLSHDIVAYAIENALTFLPIR